MFVIDPIAYDRMVADCLNGYPLEACGLLIGEGTQVKQVYPARNEAQSARVYTVHPLDMLHADQHAEAAGLEIVGVYHSHTRSEAFPSPTDVAQAPDPGWLYVLVSLRLEIEEVRGYRIEHGNICEVPLVVESTKIQ